MTTIDPGQLVPALPYRTIDLCDWCGRRATWLGVSYEDLVARACATHRINLRDKPA